MMWIPRLQRWIATQQNVFIDSWDQGGVFSWAECISRILSRSSIINDLFLSFSWLSALSSSYISYPSHSWRDLDFPLPYFRVVCDGGIWQLAGELVCFRRLDQKWLLQDSTAVQVRVLQQLLVSMYYQKSKYSKSWYNQNLSVISYSNFSIIYYSKPQKGILKSPKTDVSQIHVFYKKIIFKRAKNSILVYFLFKSGLRPYHGHQVIRFYSTQRCLTSRVGHLAASSCSSSSVQMYILNP